MSDVADHPVDVNGANRCMRPSLEGERQSLSKLG